MEGALRVEDRTLAVALWVSLGLHLLFFLLVPGPGETSESGSIAVMVEWLPAEPPPPIVSRESQREPEAEAFERAVEEPIMATDTDPVLATVSDQVPDHLPATVSVSGMDTDTVTDSVTDSVTVSVPFADLDSPESDPIDLDTTRIEALLDLTAEKIRRQSAETRYRFIEVRERVQLALESVHPGARFVRQDQARFRCILSFRIDDSGYIYDLGLRLPPGSGLDPRTIERAIATLNPLAAPPREARPPLEFEWRIDFLE